MMQVVVMKLDYQDDKSKKKVMKVASDHSGVVSVAMDTKEKKLTVIGDIDPPVLVNKLTKLCPVDLLSVRPLPKKDQAEEYIDTYDSHRRSIQYPPPYFRDRQEDPKACVIC